MKRKLTLKGNLSRLFYILLFIIIAIWLLFYLIVSQTLNSHPHPPCTSIFTLAALLTLLALILILFLFMRAMQKLFVKPMLIVMDNVQKIGASPDSAKLQTTGQQEFDQLVQQINSIVTRLDENTRTLFQMQYRMQTIEFERQQAILISLKKQINAHFTVNTLSVVKRFNETGESEKAGAICDSLSALLRYANGVDELISCRNELYMLEQYVDIMRLRYPNRFTVEFDAEEELDDILLPRMLVQPIVENAISHGILAAEQGELYISAREEQELLIFTIKNTGKGISTERLQELRECIEDAPNNIWEDKGIEHIALPNIQKRVVSMFGEKYGLQIASVLEEGTTVTLTLPVCRQ